MIRLSGGGVTGRPVFAARARLRISSVRTPPDIQSTAVDRQPDVEGPVRPVGGGGGVDERHASPDPGSAGRSAGSSGSRTAGCRSWSRRRDRRRRCGPPRRPGRWPSSSVDHADPRRPRAAAASRTGPAAGRCVVSPSPAGCPARRAASHVDVGEVPGRPPRPTPSRPGRRLGVELEPPGRLDRPQPQPGAAAQIGGGDDVLGEPVQPDVLGAGAAEAPPESPASSAEHVDRGRLRRRRPSLGSDRSASPAAPRPARPAPTRAACSAAATTAGDVDGWPPAGDRADRRAPSAVGGGDHRQRRGCSSRRWWSTRCRPSAGWPRRLPRTRHSRAARPRPGPVRRTLGCRPAHDRPLRRGCSEC